MSSHNKVNFDIVRTSHVELVVTDLARSEAFYLDTLGFTETSSTDERIYLRGIEDRFHHSLILTKGSFPAVAHIAYRVAGQRDLELISDFFEKGMNLPVKRVKEAEDEEGLGPAIRVQDPFGFPLEFFAKSEESEWLLRRFERHRGARVMRIDHVNVLVPEVTPIAQWYENQLGFLCSEYTETEEEPPKIWASWLRRKPTVHDIAIMTGVGPRLHHVGFSVGEKDNILDCADIL